MHYGVQTADVTIISYKPLSGLNLLDTLGTIAVACPLPLWKGTAEELVSYRARLMQAARRT